MRNNRETIYISLCKIYKRVYLVSEMQRYDSFTTSIFKIGLMDCDVTLHSSDRFHNSTAVLAMSVARGNVCVFLFIIIIY